eukprot:gene11905-13139_t
MDSFIKIFTLINDTDKNNRALLLAGPSKSARTSFLFEVAFTHATAGQKVLFISPRKIANLPCLLSNREQPSNEILSRINIVYLTEKNQIIEFMASVHLNYKDPIDLVLVDDADDFYLNQDKRNQLISQAKVLSFISDAVYYLNMAGKQHSPKRQCKFICTISTHEEGQLTTHQMEILRHWFKVIVIIKQDQELKNRFSAIIDRSSKYPQTIGFSYLLENQKITLLDLKNAQDM